MNLTTILGYVLDEPKRQTFPDGRTRMCFRVVDIRYGPGRRAESKYAVNHGAWDPRVKKGTEVVAIGTVKLNIVKGKTYVNVDAMYLFVPNIPFKPGEKPERLTAYHARKDAGPEDIIAFDRGVPDADEEENEASSIDAG